MGVPGGKLRAAVGWLLRPADDADFDQDEQAEAQLRSLGVNPEQLAAGRASRACARNVDQPPALWAWLARPFEVFAAMRRQWRVAGLGDSVHFVGLDFAVLPLFEQRLGIEPLDAAEFAVLRRLESLGAMALNAHG